MCPLLSSQKQLLLEIARRSLIEAVHNRASADIFSSGGDGLVSAGAFVTLHREGRLRGCIGQIGSPQPTGPLVAYCSRAAAREDPRFQPVQAHELAEIEIELSILSPLRPVSPEQIEIGTHGLMITSGAKRGVLLPQVAVQYRWSAGRFLEETCAKAGLNRDAWRGGAVRVEAFTADVFSESRFRQKASAALRAPAKPAYSSST
jgi:AmmeMemoRadiSam system protein A